MENQSGSKANILIVDDDMLIAESNKFLLKKSGYNVPKIAVNGKEAVEAAKNYNPDLIIMDINLGSTMDGISAAVEIQKFADIPVIFLTAYSDQETIERAKKVWPYGFLIKPFDNRELVIAIETSLVKHSYERETKEKEFLFRTLSNFAYEWELWLRPDYSFKYCSPSCQRITGYAADEFLNNTKLMYQIIHPEDRSSFDEMLKNHFVDNAEDVLTGYQFRIISKSGEIKYINHTCSPIYDEKGNYLGRRVTNVDVTEKNKAEEALRQSEEKFRNIFLNHRAVKLLIDPDTAKIIDANNAAASFYGWSLEELKKMSVFQLSLSSEEAILQNLQQLENSKQSYFEFRHRLKIGNIRDVEVFSSKIDIGGKIYIHSIVHDITDRKNIEKALIESENRLRFALEGSNDGMWDVQLQTGKVFLSPRGCEILGYKPDELDKVASVWSDLVNPDDLAATNEKLEAHISGETPIFEIQQRLRTKSGDWKWVLTRGKLVARDSDGIPLRMTGTHTDIHERKMAEAELEKHRFHLEELVETRTEELDKLNLDLVEQLRKGTELQLMLQQSLEKEKELSELKSRFISTASHEFRTPLTLILTSAGLMQRYGKKWSEDKLDEHLNKIKRSVEYLTKLLDDVLTINKSESGKIFFKPEMVDLYELCQEIIEETKFHSAANHNFVFNFSMRKLKYFADPKLIRFIITNLLSNAFKYSPAGGDVILSVQSVQDKIQITVEDEGLGIPDEDKKHLYQPFHRASNTDELPGTGLGLSIVKRSVDIHGGTIAVESRIGNGTKFTVYIPKKTSKNLLENRSDGKIS